MAWKAGLGAYAPPALKHLHLQATIHESIPWIALPSGTAARRSSDHADRQKVHRARQPIVPGASASQGRSLAAGDQRAGLAGAWPFQASRQAYALHSSPFRPDGAAARQHRRQSGTGAGQVGSVRPWPGQAIGIRSVASRIRSWGGDLWTTIKLETHPAEPRGAPRHRHRSSGQLVAIYQDAAGGRWPRHRARRLVHCWLSLRAPAGRQPPAGTCWVPQASD